MTEQQREHRNGVIIQILAMSALPGWAVVVALVLWVVVPTIDTVRNLNRSMTMLIERVDGDNKLNDLKFKQLSARDVEIEQRLAQHGQQIDRRIEKIEDGKRGWFERGNK